MLTYFVELDNRKGRTAGLSNGAQILAGEAPAAVDGLAAEMRRDGVLLHWMPAPPMRRHPWPCGLCASWSRRPLPAKSAQGPLAPRPEPLERTLLVEPARVMSIALSTRSIHFGETYEYRAQRVARVTVNGRNPGARRAPLRPGAHCGRERVSSCRAQRFGGCGNGRRERRAGPAIDLNWQPDTEADLAGYIVYRRERSRPTTAGSASRLRSRSPSPTFTMPTCSPATPIYMR